MSVIMKYKDVKQPGCENAAKLLTCANQVLQPLLAPTHSSPVMDMPSIT